MNETQEQEVQHVGHGTEKSEGAGGPYLRLKSDGQKIRIRMVSDPIKFKKSYQGKVQDAFACKVINKTTGPDGKTVEKEVMGFQYGWLIYEKVADLCNDSEWGDPINYDLEITRNGGTPSKFYSVIPKPAKPLTNEDKEMVAAADVDLVKMYVKADDQQHPSEQAQTARPGADDEYDPFANE
jgi:hypothetical protein